MSENKDLGGTPEDGTGPYDGATYRWYVLAMLTTVYTFNFIDRQILVILQESIKEDLKLSDTQLGLLSGFAFAVIYVTAGLFIGRLADRWVRRTIITWSLAIWSGMTALSGLAQNYTQLLLARIGVGLGEAGGSPPAHSMISDIFGPNQRATALSIYSMGINFGVLFGFTVGGWIDENLDWRIAFFVVGIPGVLFSLLFFFTVKEPPRGFAEKVKTVEDAPSFVEVTKVLITRRSFRHMAIAAGLHAFIGYGVLNFQPSFYIRIHDFDRAYLGLFLGISSGIFGAVGTFVGGYLTDKLAMRDGRWYLWVPALSTILTLPVQWLLYTQSWQVMGTLSVPLIGDIAFVNLVILQFITATTFAMYLAPNLALAHGLVGLRMRALSSAVLFFILNIIGLGMGPVVVGFVSDLLYPAYQEQSIRYSLLIVVTVMNIWCVFHYLMASRTVRADLANVPR